MGGWLGLGSRPLLLPVACWLVREAGPKSQAACLPQRALRWLPLPRPWLHHGVGCSLVWGRGGLGQPAQLCLALPPSAMLAPAIEAEGRPRTQWLRTAACSWRDVCAGGRKVASGT